LSELQYKNLDICHAEGLSNIWADADVIRYTNMKLPCTLEDIENRIEIFRPLDVFVVIQSGELIGEVKNSAECERPKSADYAARPLAA